MLNVANGDSPVIGYNGSGVFLTSFDFDADFYALTGFTLVVLPKSDLLARKPRIDRRTVFRNISIPTAGEWPRADHRSRRQQAGRDRPGDGGHRSIRLWHVQAQ